jgi:hypothetical protein
MDPDMNNYDLEHACTGHATMSKQTWERVYDDAWTRYYSPEHIETIMRRAVVSGISRSKIFDGVTMFGGSPQIERVHPLQFGWLRRKVRTSRRYGMPIVNPLIFYPWRLFDLVTTLGRWLQLVRRNRRIQRLVEADPAKLNYMDEALTPTTGGEVDHFVEVFADKIPHTHGAPVQAVAAGG